MNNFNIAYPLSPNDTLTFRWHKINTFMSRQKLKLVSSLEQIQLLERAIFGDWNILEYTRDFFSGLT